MSSNLGTFIIKNQWVPWPDTPRAADRLVEAKVGDTAAEKPDVCRALGAVLET